MSFVADRVLQDRRELRPAYTVDGGRIPDESRLPLPGYPGAPVVVGNHAGSQFQLDVLGEALLLLSTADRVGRLDSDNVRVLDMLVALVRDRAGQPEAGIWELDDRRWAHSRLMCVAGLRAAARRREKAGTARSRHEADEWQVLAGRLLDEVDRDCGDRSGRWQRAPGDERADAALLLPGVRGAVPAMDRRNVRTVTSVREQLSDDGYVYRFRQDPEAPLHQAEGAFVLSGFHMSLAELAMGRTTQALRWFERNRGVLGPPGLFTEEFDVVQRQSRGNLPQAFVHAAALETAQRLGEAGTDTRGFADEDR